jgi:hypothetical protein
VVNPSTLLIEGPAESGLDPVSFQHSTGCMFACTHASGWQCGG